MISLSEHYESNQLLRTDLRETLISAPLSQVGHKVQDRLTTQHLVTHISTQHDGWLVMQNGGGVAWPDGQPMNIILKKKKNCTLGIVIYPDEKCVKNKRIVHCIKKTGWSLSIFFNLIYTHTI